MAVKRRVVRKSVDTDPVVSEVRETNYQPEVKKSTSVKVSGGLTKRLILLVIALGILGFFWYRTNTWPVVAFVGMKPITRYEVNKVLYSQSGESVVDSLITQELVEQELDRMGVKVTDEEVNARLEDVRKNLGEGVSLEQVLAERGLTLNQVRNQIKLQLGIETVASKNVTITGEEVEKFAKDNAQFLTGTTDEEKKAEAEAALRQQKLQTAINDWIETVRSNGKVWRVGAKPTVTQQAQ